MVLNRVHRVPQRVEESADCKWNDRAIETHDVPRGHDHVIGERAVGVETDDPGVAADVALPRETLPADAASHVHLRRGVVALSQIGTPRLGADGVDLPAELVAVDPRRDDHLSHGRIPVIDVTIGPADRGCADLEPDLALAWLRNSDFADLGARPTLPLVHLAPAGAGTEGVQVLVHVELAQRVGRVVHVHQRAGGTQPLPGLVERGDDGVRGALLPVAGGVATGRRGVGERGLLEQGEDGGTYLYWIRKKAD